MGFPGKFGAQRVRIAMFPGKINGDFNAWRRADMIKSG
jgi:hypothetical protein